MIQHVQVRNYKSLADLSIDLERLTVFVGANGCGKTSVLEAIHHTVRAATKGPEKVFAHERHGDWVYTRGGQGDLCVRCRTASGEFGIRATPPAGFPPPADQFQKGRWEFHVTPGGPGTDVALAPARRLIFQHLNAAELARPSYPDRDPPQMEHTGYGLASVLYAMLGRDPDGFAEYVKAARSLVPRLRNIRFRPHAVFKTEHELVRFGRDTVERQHRRRLRGELILLDFEHAADVSARTASEGTMLMLGLLAVLLGPNRPQVLLFDDIEHGLHPLAQKQLVAVLVQLLGRFPDLQVVATAHSPFLLNYLSPDQVRIMATGSDGRARCGRLTDHPKFAKWKDEMAPGELWSLFGEKWLTGPEAGV